MLGNNNTSAIKIADLNLGEDGKMADHVANSTFLLNWLAGVSAFKNVT